MSECGLETLGLLRTVYLKVVKLRETQWNSMNIHQSKLFLDILSVSSLKRTAFYPFKAPEDYENRVTGLARLLPLYYIVLGVDLR